ncbi:MAG: hypothetical protein QM528_04210 [Phycisphaerales bacterium]|nr:hypothetical protein [Phycisphaerales bacterium]
MKTQSKRLGSTLTRTEIKSVSGGRQKATCTPLTFYCDGSRPNIHGYTNGKDNFYDVLCSLLPHCK